MTVYRTGQCGPHYRMVTQLSRTPKHQMSRSVQGDIAVLLPAADLGTDPGQEPRKVGLYFLSEPPYCFTQLSQIKIYSFHEWEFTHSALFSQDK